ncbi:MAG: hypothetical protein OYH77_01935 [Pseudomonadota bacterium]|nr:hypothetical protein [Pseudomonadota bacterium]
MSEYEVASEGQQSRQLKYAINLSLGANFGVIGHMYLRTVANNQGIEVHGWIEKNLRNSKSDSLGEDAEQVRSYQLDDGFALNSSTNNYNGFTLPLRLQHLMAKRIEQITKIAELSAEISREEQRLFSVAESLYKDFARLAIAKQRSLSGLAEQRNIEFAGKRFSKNLAAVKEKIAQRYSELATIDYETKKLTVAPSIYRTNTPTIVDDLFSRASAFQTQHAGVQEAPMLPKFNARGDVPTQLRYFEDVVRQLVILQQAKLQLASALCAIYEPFQTNYYFSMGGVQEHLRLMLTTVDDGKNSFARYKVKARGQNNKQFDFGYTDHDRSGMVVSMRLNLKPLGGAKGLSKLDLTLQ